MVYITRRKTTNMKWIAISGTWRHTNKEIEGAVRQIVREIISYGDGIVSGGALSVDWFATDEALKLNPSCSQIRIFLPTTLEIYARHYRKRVDEGVITHKQAEDLIAQLTAIQKANRDALIEGEHLVCNPETYFDRITKIVNASDELVAFQVNNSAGVQDTIDKAKKKGIPVKQFSYSVAVEPSK